jgi:membrane protease YdiL (CAAX protease family)
VFLQALSLALSNLVVLAGLPLLLYYIYHRRRDHLTFAETARRAGLQLGATRYVGYCIVVSLVVVAVLLILRPPLEPLNREGSGLRPFVGLGLGIPAVVMALLYGAVQTAFCEELLFRGLIAGSLSRRLPLLWADILQAAVFLIPHLLVLTVMPEMSRVLPLIFIGGLFAGWARIKSGSILGPWILHAWINIAMALSIAARSAV